jgi:hypothetical protein
LNGTTEKISNHATIGPKQSDGANPLGAIYLATYHLTQEDQSMTMFPTISGLSVPHDSAKIPGATVSYVQARNRRHLFNFIQAEFKKSGITRAQLGARTGKGSDRISRLLGQPGNLTADTSAELLFAISGAEIQYSVIYPLSQQTKAHTPPRGTLANSGPYWLPTREHETSGMANVQPIIGTPKGTIVPSSDQSIHVIAA